jgi:hypothetical protein
LSARAEAGCFCPGRGLGRSVAFDAEKGGGSTPAFHRGGPNAAGDSPTAKSLSNSIVRVSSMVDDDGDGSVTTATRPVNCTGTQRSRQMFPSAPIGQCKACALSDFRRARQGALDAWVRISYPRVSHLLTLPLMISSQRSGPFARRASNGSSRGARRHGVKEAGLCSRSTLLSRKKRVTVSVDPT